MTKPMLLIENLLSIAMLILVVFHLGSSSRLNFADGIHYSVAVRYIGTLPRVFIHHMLQ
ncbi:hypothetical protein C8R27_13714 [Nitrosomonas ureae]|nr:hypothetical protein C8R27_13714 [Nitrosomonas ureae]